MLREIKPGIYWTGAVDWEIRKIHGEEYSTHRGTTYNSYLVRDKKTVLIDTVSSPFAPEFVENLDKEAGLDTIDAVIANHAEPDHGGALAALMARLPDRPVYCTANGVKSLRGNYHQDWNLVPVKAGDTLDLGRGKLVFIEAPMLHWPDTMLTYLTGANVLFSNDAFGQHLATGLLFNDQQDQAELYQEAIKYYANILTPFSRLVEKKVAELMNLGLPLDMICPSHGAIWRSEPLQIVTKYLDWARDWREDRITVVFDSMWGGTRAMAEAIASGIESADGRVTVRRFNIARSDKNDVVTEVFRSKAVLVGSSTINNGMLSSVAGFLEEIRGLKFRGKKAAAFGSYGWSGEAVKLISEGLERAGFELLSAGLRSPWNPDAQALAECFELGRRIAVMTKDSS